MDMIELYASGTPNVQKIHIMLEELGLEYRSRWINVYRGEQFAPDFVKLNPNSKVPVIVDHDGPQGHPYTVFESGAILIYLAEKTGSPLLPAEPLKRCDVMQWLMIQLTGIGPMFGQFNHFRRFAPPGNEYSDRRYTSENRRLYDLLEARLGQARYLGGDDYSIADIATFPWIRNHAKRFGETLAFMRIGFEGMPHLARWFAAIETRPAVARALVTIDANPSPNWTATPDDLDRFFGRGRYARG
ncbi:MAG: glutathione S-transferase N-terminal domain-containing protein [bacterium]|nr:glutathione S-transferase N-terminal domain-containing protein [bacterium]